MEKIINGIKLGIGFTFVLSIFCIIGFYTVKARGTAPNDLQSSAGDKITSTKRNQLVGNLIKTNGSKSMTSNGLYCGVTGSYNGAGVGGYEGAKTKCETACGDSLAHMCDAHEVYMSKSLGISVTANTWYSSFVRSYRTLPASITDCGGRTVSTSSTAGSLVRAANAGIDTCNNAYPIACCK